MLSVGINNNNVSFFFNTPTFDHFWSLDFAARQRCTADAGHLPQCNAVSVPGDHCPRVGRRRRRPRLQHAHRKLSGAAGCLRARQHTGGVRGDLRTALRGLCTRAPRPDSLQRKRRAVSDGADSRPGCTKPESRIPGHWDRRARAPRLPKRYKSATGRHFHGFRQ